MATLRFLGTAAYPRRDEPVHLLVESGAQRLLVDAGPSIVRTLDELSIVPTAIDEIFLTHQHADHLLGVPYVLLGRHLTRLGATRDDPETVRDVPATVRGPSAALDALDAVLEATTPGSKSLLAPRERFAPTTPGETFAVGTVAVTVTPAIHPVPTQGLLFDGPERRVLYTADTGETDPIADAVVSDELVPAGESESIDAVIHEAMYTGERATLAAELDHATARQAGRFASQLGAQELYLVHQADVYGDDHRSFREQAATAFDGEIRCPNRFETIEL